MKIVISALLVTALVSECATTGPTGPDPKFDTTSYDIQTPEDRESSLKSDIKYAILNGFVPVAMVEELLRP